jgi:prolyl-tRNA synthetase
MTPGFKFNEWEKKGIPVRVEIGPRDVKSEQVIACRRDTSEKITMQNKTAVIEIKGLLETMQKDLFKTAEERLNTKVYDVNSYEEFKEVIKKKPGL